MMRTVWMFLAATLAACSGSSLGLDELDAAMHDARCTRLVRCGLFASTEACDAYARLPPPSSFGPAEQAGHLAFDGGQAKACQDALAAQSCESMARDVRVVPEACAKMFAGKIAEAAACAFDEECASSRCDVGACPAGACCAGTCEPAHAAGAVGDACTRDGECVGGFCDTDHTCHAVGAAQATCMRDAQCDYGLACLSSSPSLPGTCAALPKLGEACPYQRCAAIGTYCDSTAHCAALGLPGAPCNAQADCSPFDECDLVNHVCVVLPTLGQPCDVGCAGESYCERNDAGVGTCTTPQPNGTPCEESDKCLSQNCKPGAIFDSCQDYPICP